MLDLAAELKSAMLCIKSEADHHIGITEAHADQIRQLIQIIEVQEQRIALLVDFSTGQLGINDKQFAVNESIIADLRAKI